MHLVKICSVAVLTLAVSAQAQVSQDTDLTQAVDQAAFQRSPSIPFAAPATAGIEPAGQFDLWMSPVLRQRKGAMTTNNEASAGGATVRVARSNGDGEQDAREETLRAAGDPPPAEEESVDAARYTMMLQAEAEEKRLCRREPRNAFERVGGFFGARYHEECPRSRRRRETIRVSHRSDATAENVIYAINPSATQPLRVQISCRIPATGATFGTELSVDPRGIGQFKAPCACEEDYEFWCAVRGSRPLLAHAVLKQRSATADVEEYIDFTPARIAQY